jgi:hypothetical protein
MSENIERDKVQVNQPPTLEALINAWRECGSPLPLRAALAHLASPETEAPGVGIMFHQDRVTYRGFEYPLPTLPMPLDPEVDANAILAVIRAGHRKEDSYLNLSSTKASSWVKVQRSGANYVAWGMSELFNLPPVIVVPGNYDPETVIEALLGRLEAGHTLPLVISVNNEVIPARIEGGHLLVGAREMRELPILSDDELDIMAARCAFRARTSMGAVEVDLGPGREIYPGARSYHLYGVLTDGRRVLSEIRVSNGVECLGVPGATSLLGRENVPVIFVS